MKYIIKQKSPQEFEDWKIRKRLTKVELLRKKKLQKEQRDIWKVFQKKTDVRNIVKHALLYDQGFICCYCQNTIDSSIEHFVSRDADASQMFDYENLLVCCKGGEEERQNQIYPSFCGSEKKSENLSISPLDINCQEHFDYFIVKKEEKIHVGVRGTTSEGTNAIKILNLDNDELRRIRGEVLSAYLEDSLSIEEIIQIRNFFINQIETKPNNKYPAFCIVILNLLDKLLH